MAGIPFAEINELAPAAVAGPGPERDELLRMCLTDLVPWMIRTKGYYLPSGGDMDDLVQEAMQGILGALRSWDPDKKTLWTNWALICAERDVIQAIKAANRQMRKGQNEAVSLDMPAHYGRHRNQPSDDRRVDQWRFDPGGGPGTDPVEVVMARESEQEAMRLLKALSSGMSPMERTMFQMCVLGQHSYAQAGQAMGKQPKATDNAMQRTRRKLARRVRELAVVSRLWPETRELLAEVAQKVEINPRHVKPAALTLATMTPEQARVERIKRNREGYRRWQSLGHLLMPYARQLLEMYYRGDSAQEMIAAMEIPGQEPRKGLTTRVRCYMETMKRFEERHAKVAGD